MDEERRGFQKGDWALFLRFLHYVRSHSRPLLLAIIAMAGASVAQVAGPYLIKVGIDQYILPGRIDQLWNIAGLYLLMLATLFGCAFIQTTVIGDVGQRICLKLRDDLYAHLQRLPLRFFYSQPVGRTVTRLTNDVEALSELVSSGVVAILSDVLLLAGIAAVMFWMNSGIALMAFLLLPPLVALTWRFRTRVRESFRAIRLKLARLNAFLNERVQGMRVIRAFNAESETADRHAGVNADHYEAHMDSIRLFAVYNPLVDLIGALSVAVLIWYSAGRILSGHLTFGELVAFLVYLEMFYKPIRDLAEKYNILQAALAAMEKVFGLMDEPVEDLPRGDGRARQPWAIAPGNHLRGEIVFDRVTFAYETLQGKRSADVLRDLSFEIRPGEKVAIVGATGAGKSTIASLILGFYSPQSGRILLDGVPVREYDLPVVRRRIGYITQEPFLFSGTLEDNITLEDATISPAAVRHAVDACGLAGGRYPQGLKTRIAERGVTFSAGERQLIAFGRCMAFEPDILMLDEATAAVDSVTERWIERAFGMLSKNRTAVVIAHRQSLVQICDRILVIHQGRLVESGSHEELVRRGGVYSMIFRLQEVA